MELMKAFRIVWPLGPGVKAVVGSRPGVSRERAASVPEDHRRGLEGGMVSLRKPGE